MVAVTAGFMFNRWDLEILPYYRIRHIPWCVRYHAQSLRLEAFEYFYVGRECDSSGMPSNKKDWRFYRIYLCKIRFFFLFLRKPLASTKISCGQKLIDYVHLDELYVKLLPLRCYSIRIGTNSF
jgi:hypothetical protein